MYECIYEDDHIRLRKACHEDAEFLHKLVNDEEVMVYYGEIDRSYENALSDIKWFNSLFEKHAGRWVIEDKTSSSYIGDIGVYDYHDKHKKAEVGFKLDKNYWNKGIMSKCLQALLRIAFLEWDYNRIEAFVDVRNTACISLLLKNGFIKEGTLRDYEFEHGHYVDLEIHSILRKDYLSETSHLL